MKRNRTEIERVPFHNFIPVSANATTTSSQVNLSPNSSISPRALAIADAWAHFRMRNFMFRVLPSPVIADADTESMVIDVGVMGGIQDSIPLAGVSIRELIPSTHLNSGMSVPTQWVNVPKPDLRGPLEWYKTIPGTADPTEEAPGLLVYSMTGTGSVAYTILIEVRGVFEFKTAVATGATPLMRELLSRLHEEKERVVREREKNQVLRTLAFADQTKGSSDSKKAAK